MLTPLYAIAVLLLILALPYGIAIWSIRHTTMRCMTITPAETKAIPEHLKAMFKGAIAELKPYGFKVAGCYRIALGPEKDGMQWGILLQHTSGHSSGHSSGHTCAGLMTRSITSSATPLTLTFITFFQDNCQLVTLNSPKFAIYSANPQEIAQHVGNTDVGPEAIASQWQTHQHKLTELLQTKSLLAVSTKALAKKLEASENAGIQHLIARREVSWVEPEKSYHMSWKTAIWAVFQVARKSQSIPVKQTASDAIASPSTTSITPLVELEIEEFHRLQQKQKTGTSQRNKSWLLLGTLALFIASYSSIFEPQKLFIFVAVLLLHEAGHVLAMKFFGYRNTMMLFIPFLGALATARKEDASLTEKVWISLAGPLPGLILGIGLAIAFGMPDVTDPTLATWFSETNWVREISWTLIILNLFNLLPIYPLDGGQVADLLLFSRNPYLGVAFKGMGVLLLALLGLTQPLMLAFALVIAITIPTSFRMAKLNAKFRQELRQMAPGDRDGTLRFLFTQLQNPPYRALTFPQKYGLVTGLLDTRQEDAARWRVRVGLASLYIVSLLGGLMGGLYALLPNWSLLSATLGTVVNLQGAYHHRTGTISFLQQRLTTLNQALDQNPKDKEAYLGRAGVYYALKRYPDAIADSNQALLIDAQSVAAVLMRGEAYLALKKYPEALGNANHALRLDAHSSEAYDLRSRVRHRLGDQPGAIADQQKADYLFQAEEDGPINEE